MRPLLLLVVLSMCVGCRPAKVTEPAALPPMPHKVVRIAIAPSGGILADAIGLDLFGQGLDIVDSAEVTSLLRDSTGEAELMKPQSLATLKNAGVDAVLSCRVVIGHDGSPDSAVVRLISSHNGRMIGGATYENGSHGQKGSMADEDIRKPLTYAASKLAAVILRQIRR